MYACRIPLSPSFHLNLVGGWVGGHVSECVCVFAVPIYFHFFPLAFVLVNDLFSGFSLFLLWKCVRFCFCFCCCLLVFAVCTCILCLLPCLTRYSFNDVLSCTPTGVSELNYLTWLGVSRPTTVHRRSWTYMSSYSALLNVHSVYSHARWEWP